MPVLPELVLVVAFTAVVVVVEKVGFVLSIAVLDIDE